MPPVFDAPQSAGNPAIRGSGTDSALMSPFGRIAGDRITANLPPEYSDPAHRKAQNRSAPARQTTAIPGTSDGHNPFMDATQSKIIELLREVHLIAFKEIERLNLRIAELESHVCHPAPAPAKAKVVERTTANPPSASKPQEIGLLTEHEVAAYLKISVASVRRWRSFRTGPKFVKIGSSVRYKRNDMEAWLNSCPGLR